MRSLLNTHNSNIVKKNPNHGGIVRVFLQYYSLLFRIFARISVTTMQSRAYVRKTQHAIDIIQRTSPRRKGEFKAKRGTTRLTRTGSTNIGKRPDAILSVPELARMQLIAIVGSQMLQGVSHLAIAPSQSPRLNWRKWGRVGPQGCRRASTASASGVEAGQEPDRLTERTGEMSGGCADTDDKVEIGDEGGGISNVVKFRRLVAEAHRHWPVASLFGRLTKRAALVRHPAAETARSLNVKQS
jgi:hypothetical protein